MTPLRPSTGRDEEKIVTFDRCGISAWPNGIATIVESVGVVDLGEVEVAGDVEDQPLASLARSDWTFPWTSIRAEPCEVGAERLAQARQLVGSFELERAGGRERLAGQAG